MEIEINKEGNAEQGLFRLVVDGENAGFIDYFLTGDNEITIKHTVVEKKFGGQGLARKLVMRVKEYAEENNLTILPECSYAKKVLEG
ncbi:MAG: N-acetyltransferase [Chitinophagales bacterium]|nr:N-acetyltransferase [Chitinophagales bacterium]